MRLLATLFYSQSSRARAGTMKKEKATTEQNKGAPQAQRTHPRQTWRDGLHQSKLEGGNSCGFGVPFDPPPPSRHITRINHIHGVPRNVGRSYSRMPSNTLPRALRTNRHTHTHTHTHSSNRSNERTRTTANNNRNDDDDAHQQEEKEVIGTRDAERRFFVSSVLPSHQSQQNDGKWKDPSVQVLLKIPRRSVSLRTHVFRTFSNTSETQ